ncbi:MAG: hypothetical protein H6868_08290 [Rhodospirillales bacterium]|nr:hypothetical protein [Rhodospirillales bacterium]
MHTKISKSSAAMLLCAALASAANARDDLGSCTQIIAPYVAAQDSSAAPGRELFVLIDQTVVPDDKLKSELVQKILRFLQPGDRLSVATFSAFAKGHYTELVFAGTFDRGLPENQRGDVPIKKARAFDRCLQVQQQKGKALITAKLQQSFTGDGETYDFDNTELIGALQTLSYDLIGKSQASKKTLLIFSDMLENSPVVSVFSKGSVRIINPDIELAKVKKADQLPALTGTAVYVIGAGWLKGGKLYQDSRKLRPLRRFWEQLFAASGAALAGYGEPMLLTDLR